MPLPATGPISINDVNVELLLPATNTTSLNDPLVRQLAERLTPASTISMEDLRGKSFDSFPVGSVVAFASNTTTPRGRWFPCDWRVLSQAAYPDLFAVIGNTYTENNDGAGNFRIPDLRGRFIRGTGSDGSEGMSPAQFGRKQDANFRSHSHFIANVTHFRAGTNLCPWTFISCPPRCPANGGYANWYTPSPGNMTSARSAPEVRPYNVGMQWYIKY